MATKRIAVRVFRRALDDLMNNDPDKAACGAAIGRGLAVVWAIHAARRKPRRKRK